MGWTYFCGNLELKDGKIDRKATMTREIEKYGRTKVLKCSVVNGVYYAACQTVGKPDVWAIVCLTRASERFLEFGYKDMDETMGPFESKCPKSIIDMLTPTTSEWANEWRRRCLNRQPSAIERFRKLPIGARIRFNGQEFIKMAPAYQFKTTWIKYADRFCSYPKKYLTNDFEVVA